MKKIDIIELMMKEIPDTGSTQLAKIKLYMKLHKGLCNDVLYTDYKYKDSTIILTNIFNNLMSDFCKEVTDYLNEEGVYNHE